MVSVGMTITRDSAKPKPWYKFFCAHCHIRRAVDHKDFNSFESSSNRRGMRQNYICHTCLKRYQTEVDAMMWRACREWAEPMMNARYDEKMKQYQGGNNA